MSHLRSAESVLGPTTCPFKSDSELSSVYTDWRIRPIPGYLVILIQNTCMWLIHGIYLSSKRWHQSGGLRKMVSQWKMDQNWSLRLWDVTDFGSFSMATSQWGGWGFILLTFFFYLPVDDGRCYVYSTYRRCIVWVRHLWSSGNWEPVFACQ